MTDDANKLSPALLKKTYRQGYFPMPDPDTDEILWFRPDPRAVIPLDAFHCSRSLKQTLNSGKYRITHDTAFKEVMVCCSQRENTWINEEILEAYTALFHEGSAHSIEVWQENDLVGGVYGVTLGGAFFAESKFHFETDASKVALYHLVERLKRQGFKLLEVQFITDHLKSLGAIEINDREYQSQLRDAISLPVTFS